MSLNPLRWIEWLINEHGTSTIIRERLAQSRDETAAALLKLAASEAKVAALESRLEKAQMEIEQLKQVNRELEEDRQPTPSKPGGGF